MPYIWLIIGLLGAIWVFWDTRKQGYTFESSLRWAMGALLVPAVVIPFYILQANLIKKLKRYNKRTEPQDVTSEMYQRCPRCGKFYRGNLEKCPHCHKSISED
ncbi:hypothetical protein [Desulfotomaculum nigrificans]|uniref:hypothetical protein n=1 Tax=Desulfotomaculum nigrificans TaxID=1565 RepID=UPI0001FADDED|nr:hypothetical protein [Desulfotomaculum nigrificans]